MRLIRTYHIYLLAQVKDKNDEVRAEMELEAHRALEAQREVNGVKIVNRIDRASIQPDYTSINEHRRRLEFR